MSTPEARLSELGITLPEPMKAVANYVPYVISGNLLYVSGQVSATPDGRISGRLGETMDLPAGQNAARHCGINLIAQCKAALGELSRVKRVVKLGGFVNSHPLFTDIPQVINGCSDLFVAVIGERGRHARSAVGLRSLPNDMTVEIEAVIRIDA